MRVIPEINIMNGHCVKKDKGSYHYSEMISHSPRKIAKMWEEQGASYLHLRDLDGMMARHVMNHESIKKVVDCVSIPIEIYGGICSLKEIENMLNLGIRQVVLDPNCCSLNFMKEAIGCFGTDKIAVNLQSSFGGAKHHLGDKLSVGIMYDTVRKIIALGITKIEYESKMTDTYAFASNLEYLTNVMKEFKMDLIVSGGVTTLKELESLYNVGVYGVILGDELYERRIELKYAVELFEEGGSGYGL